jgi:SAM-dependent methyltransferase
MNAVTFDETKSEAFAERMLGVLNDAALALMTSLGHQVGLFDAMAGSGAATSEQIAGASGLNERYVREWLGAMVTGRIVEYDQASGTYALPAEHWSWLTRAAGVDNLAVQAQYIPLLAQVEQQLIECFRHGGGVPYSAYPRFQELMGEESSAVHDAALIDAILPIVPGLVERLQQGIDVADIGCGRGHAINLMAETFPQSRFTGYDLSDEGIAAARAEAERMGLANASFDVRDVAALGVRHAYDLITAFDAIHDQAQPARVLRGIAEALRPGGTFLMVDIAASSNLAENVDLPLAPFLYTISCMHCMTVSLAMDGSGLGAMWGEQTARGMLADAGFEQVEVHNVEGDVFNHYYVARITRTPAA